MKHAWKLFGILVVLLATALPVEAQRKIGVVLERTIDRSHDAAVIQIATQAFTDSRSFEVVERAQLQKIIDEQNLQSFTGKDIQVLADLAGLDYLALVGYSVHAESSQAGTMYDYAIACRMVDTGSGVVMTTIRSETAGWKKMLRNPFGKSGAASAADLMTQQIRQEFPVEGYVIKTTGEELVVDLGEMAGVGKGDVLAVIRQGEDILHPVTKERIPGEEREVAELKVQSASADVSICSLKSNGSFPEIGDRVRFKK